MTVNRQLLELVWELGREAKERDLEQALAEHIQKFLLELGQGFAFMGRQVALEVEGELEGRGKNQD